MWAKVRLNVIYLLTDSRKKCLVIAREDLSRWPEAKALTSVTTKEITTFI